MKNKLFVTSDHHFFHKNIIKLTNRPFKTLDEMHEYMIAKWNERVTPNDTVYHLGDFSLSNAVKTENILSRLNGTLFLIRGNHDRWVNKTTIGHKLILLDDIHVLKLDGNSFVLSHYPLLDWEGRYKGYYHLHGHTHGSIQKNRVRGSLDIGVDSLGYMPMSFESLAEMLKGDLDVQS